MTRLAGSKHTVEFGPGLPTLLINDQLRVYDQDPAILAALQTGNFEPLVTLARAGQAAGCAAVDLLLDHHQLDEVELLPRAVHAIDQTLGCPISLDSRNPAAIERAMDGYPGKALLNSITGEPHLLESLLPLVARFGMAVVALLTDDVSIPQSWRERLAVAHKIVAATDAAGIPREDVLLDCVCLAAATIPGSMQVTLDTLKAVRDELGMTTFLGIGNAGFGMPEPTRLDRTYLTIAIPWGLDAALVDYHTPDLLMTTRAADFLAGNDPYGAEYIGLYRQRNPRRS